MPKLLPKIIVLAGYGLNCEEETAAAFTLSGGNADVVHINDLIAKPKLLNQYQILAIPGGFSYGDDLGGGKAYANKLNNHLKDHLNSFAEQDKLILGICNGFQILTQAGLLPGTLSFNDNNRYTDRWVDVKMTQQISNNNSVSSRASNISNIKGESVLGEALSEAEGDPLNSDKPSISDSSAPARMHSPSVGMTDKISPWLTGIDHLSLPIAHGEGKYGISDTELKSLKTHNQIAGVYYKGEVCTYQNLEPNPNGALLDIAMITSANGKILGTMPHPERAMFFTQSPDWPLQKEKLIRNGKKLPKFGEGLKIFQNAINYFK